MTRSHPQSELPPVERFAARSVLGLVGVIGTGAVFTLLLVTVLASWEPLRALDTGVAQRLNDLVSARPVLVTVLGALTELGGSPASWLIVTVLTVWLLIRRLPRLALFVAVTGAGAAVLSPAVKELVGRARPVVEVEVATTPGRSFPSGHVLGSTVAYGLLLLVFLPAARRRARAALIGSAAAVLVVIGFTRVALGVHYVSDVLAGWALGAAWLGVTAAAFRRWRRERGLPPAPVARGLASEAAAQIRPAPDADTDRLPHPWQLAAALTVTWVLLFGLLAGAGLLRTRALDGSWLDTADSTAMRWFASLRDPALTPLMGLASRLGGTAVVVAIAAAASALSLAVTRRWRPLLFLGAVMVGEVTLFLAVAALVRRPRPDVPHLGPQLPPTSSFPSGHVAAAVALYGAIALLTLAWTGGRGRWRWLGRAALACALVLPVLVAAARFYRGVHFPTDVLGSLLLSLPWLAACWHLVHPVPHQATPQAGKAPTAEDPPSRRPAA
jgi:undecaprenyl-diphosphatase